MGSRISGGEQIPQGIRQETRGKRSIGTQQFFHNKLTRTEKKKKPKQNGGLYFMRMGKEKVFHAHQQVESEGIRGEIEQLRLNERCKKTETNRTKRVYQTNRDQGRISSEEKKSHKRKGTKGRKGAGPQKRAEVEANDASAIPRKGGPVR